MSRPMNKEEYRAELADAFAHVLEEKGLEWKKEWRGQGGGAPGQEKPAPLLCAQRRHTERKQAAGGGDQDQPKEGQEAADSGHHGRGPERIKQRGRQPAVGQTRGSKGQGTTQEDLGQQLATAGWDGL